jgi:hypothetical protein
LGGLSVAVRCRGVSVWPGVLGTVSTGVELPRFPGQFGLGAG